MEYAWLKKSSINLHVAIESNRATQSINLHAAIESNRARWEVESELCSLHYLNGEPNKLFYATPLVFTVVLVMEHGFSDLLTIQFGLS